MQWSADERTQFATYFGELWPRTREWPASRLSLYVEVCQRRQVPFWAAGEALRDLRVEWATETPPMAVLVAQQAEGNYRRETAVRRMPQQAEGYPDPPMSGWDFSLLDDWWNPRVNHPNKSLRAKYRLLREVVRKNGLPTIIREPGEEG